jgi:hypothetical protein
LQPASEFPDVDAAGPVFDVMKPIFTESGVTPGAGSAAPAPLIPVTHRASATLPATAILNDRIWNFPTIPPWRKISRPFSDSLALSTRDRPERSYQGLTLSPAKAIDPGVGRDLVERHRHLGHRGTDALGHRREHVEVEAVDARRVEADHARHLVGVDAGEAVA